MDFAESQQTGGEAAGLPVTLRFNTTFSSTKEAKVALTWVARRTSAQTASIIIFNIYLAIASLRARRVFSYSMRDLGPVIECMES